MTAQQLLNSVGPDKWKKAVSHPFLDACIDGSIRPEQFNRWLAQDYYYVRGFATFAGAVLASAPDKHIEVLISGIAALTDELAWFKDTAARRDIDLAGTGMQPTCRDYRAFLARLHTESYPVQAAAFWAIEKCYHEAWGSVLQKGTAQEYKEYGHRWGSPAFGEYVKQLQQHADEALEQSHSHKAAAQKVINEVAELEEKFWAMAYNDSA